MIVPFFGIDEMPPLIIKFYDKDKFGSEYIGHRIISLQQGIIEGFVYFNKAEVPEPKWLDLNYGLNFFVINKILKK